MSGGGDDRDAGRWRFLALACLALVLSLTTWFSATAVIPALKALWHLDGTAAAWLTNGVQAGFVIGALASSFLGLADRWRLTRMLAASAVVAALANAVLLVAPGAGAAILARVVTGIALAGIYPPSVKLLATWFRRGRGLALGLMIGALTLGSALPHLISAFGGGLDWRPVVAASSLMCLGAALIFGLLLHEGPYPFARTTVSLRRVGAIFRNRPVMLANIGYFGHMWELYAFWGWFLAYARAAGPGPLAPLGGNASLLTFLVLAVGVAGCVLGGVLSDRIGRSATTALALALSCACSILIGFAFAGPAWLFITIALVWGVAVIADSAQFSAAVTELAEDSLVGSALALQMGIGFAITIVSIWTLPIAASLLGGWRWVFLLLAPGPLIGLAAMIVLRGLPQARAMAGGRR